MKKEILFVLFFLFLGINPSNAWNGNPLESATVEVYPNPFENILVIEHEISTDQTAFVEVFDVLGKAIYQSAHLFSEEQQRVEIDLSSFELAAGFYLIRMNIDDKILTYRLQRAS